MRSVYFLLILGVVLVTVAVVSRTGIASRNDPRDRPINSAMREAIDRRNPQFSAEDELMLAQRFGTAVRRPSGLRWVERAPGTGVATPPLGGGRLLDGTPFDDSRKRGAPFTFRVGTGSVIRGWDEAFLTMRKGEKRTLIVPYWLAYGEKGRPPKIPPKATLIFEVELVDWR
ncbi:MAG: hypothetical protein RL479_2666 [Verrucomicrobiota bacterium]